MQVAAPAFGPQSPEAYEAELALQLEKLRELLGTYLKPDDIDAMNALGYTLADGNVKLEEALGFIERALKVKSDEPAVIEYTRKHLANFKTPRSVVFVAELPRNPGGKVVKPTLREMV